MLPNDAYYTIQNVAEAEYKSKGSRFIAMAYPVQNEHEIKETLQSLWKQHHKATHICYAWRLGLDKNYFRANDDGEPSGTAGKPILGQIDSYNLTEIAVFVIRYYGGTPLGTSGLIQAYKTSAQQALQQSNIIVKHVYDTMKISFPYALYNKIYQQLMKEEVIIHQNIIDNTCFIEFSVRLAKKVFLVNFINEIRDVLYIETN